MPEFGGDELHQLPGVPVYLGAAETTSFDEVECVSLVCPAGVTFVLLGVDWYFSATGDSQGFGTLLGASGNNVWGGWTPLAPVIFGGGLEWRGAVPIYPGNTMAAIGSVNPDGAAVGIQMWGIILPYVAP